MAILVACLLVLFVVLLVFGLLSLLYEWVRCSTHDSPVFHDQGPIFHDQAAERETRSQFAWQSRSHCRARD